MRKLKHCTLFLISIPILFLIGCRDEEIFIRNESQTQKIISKSLWKEDMKFIENVKEIFELDFKCNNYKYPKNAVKWEYALTYGHFDESFL